MNIEDLMKIQVTTASRRSQSLSRVPAAVFVINQEDIRRSGMLNLPELLRMVPGLNVASVDGNKWSITARGFNSRFAQKLQVLVDGRSVYDLFFSGTLWETLDLPLEEIERIEVIRGPGSALWGANAVNGIINIITKNARDSQGNLVTGGIGNKEDGFGMIRHGGTLGADSFYRVYGKYANRVSLRDVTQFRGNDQWRMSRAGSRIDSGDPATRNGRFTFIGDVYEDDLGRRTTLPTGLIDTVNNWSGWSSILRWERQPREGQNTLAQASFARTKLLGPEASERRGLFDLDLQHRVQMGRHTVIGGIGWRSTSDDLTSTPIVIMTPPKRHDNLYSGFVHDEIGLNPKLQLTMGAKIEHNSYTGLEVQPNVRAAWTPDERQTLWAAVTRAVRTPSRCDHGCAINVAFPPPVVVQFRGNTAFRSESLIAYELGYRVQPRNRLFLDLAAFYHSYRHLEVIEPGALELAPVPTLPFNFVNKGRGNVYGAELAGRWDVSNQWRLSFSYATLQSHLGMLNSAPGSIFLTPLTSPRRQVNLRSFFDIGKNLQFDISAYMPGHVSDSNIPSYERVDARLGWRPSKRLEIVLGALNVQRTRHQESTQFFFDVPGRMERSFYAKVNWLF
jgi:iron complex outermembrane receptor protein